ncbi:hypothetical protein QUA35_06935 [Microcoleus sp. N9_B2]
MTNYIVTKSRPKRTGFLPNFLMKVDRLWQIEAIARRQKERSG